MIPYIALGLMLVYLLLRLCSGHGRPRVKPRAIEPWKPLTTTGQRPRQVRGRPWET